MTIWINNPFDFLPGEGARLQRYGLLCQALAQAGHQVVWWSSDWNHIKKEKREEKCANAGMRECANGGETPRQGEADPSRVEIRLIKTMPYRKNMGLRRLISHWRYARAWEREARNASEKPDLIICSAPPLSTGFVMRRLCKRLGCTGVIDVMDVWPETFERVAPRWLLWPLRWMAKQVYNRADAISAVGDSYLAVVKGYLNDPESKPMYRCYHGIERQVLKFESSKVLKLGEKIETGASLRLVYVGNMGRGYDLETLVRAVLEMIEEGYAIGLDFAGRGEQEPFLKSLAAAKTSAICFHGVVSGEQLYELLGQADLGVVPMFSKTYVAVPYKLADYAVSGLPVVNSLRGETSALLKQYACGWQYEAGSLASLKQTLKEVYELKQGDSAAFEARGHNARRLAEECFDSERIYPAFVRWLEGFCDHKVVTME